MQFVKLRCTLVIAICLCAPVPALAAASDAPVVVTVTLDRAISLAYESNPEFASIRLDEDAAAALARQSAMRPNPNASYELEDVRAGNRGSGVSVAIPIELGGKRQARMRAADLATEVSQASIAVRRTELRASVVQFFFELLAAQEQMQLAQSSVETAGRTLDAAARRVQAGRISPVEQTRARVAHASSRIELSQAVTEVANARLRLRALWGADQSDFVAIEPPAVQLPELPSQENILARAAQAPEVLRGTAEIERRNAQVALARAQAVPAFAINLGSRSLTETGQRANLLGLSVSIPLFDRNQGNIDESLVRVEQARLQSSSLQLRIRYEALQARQRLDAARREAQTASEEIVPDATGALEAAIRGFELGKFSFLDVLEAQRALVVARGQRLRALTQAYRSAADIERLLGPDTATNRP